MEESFILAIAPVISALCANNGLADYWPNRNKIDTSDNHARITILPVEPRTLGVCSSIAEYKWLVQISIYIRDNKGVIGIAGMLDAMRESIAFGNKYTHSGNEYTVSKQGNIAPAINIDGWYTQSVTFQFSKIK
jgi:hypothetical protein